MSAIALKQSQSLKDTLLLLPLNKLLPELIEITEGADKPGKIGLGLTMWAGLPDERTTYSWIGMLCKRYSLESLRETALGILLTGTTVKDFDDSPRHMRAWVTATVKGKYENPVTEDNGVLSLERFSING
jgi:hypothetical protein